ncbi:hypothetical protein PC116_g27631 [Phytophthora cactorum]|nr:hypothetical protein PC114_g27605 [Phytophthora cactorum]KAG2965898.1 hypothetical protein PC120_g27168 [Phytophthora cactorum]KAG4037502.1 hypothetical protein PC123_g26934 [Phytophthora cactorum]KAG4223909.1 hypothetical protein PC116_g27631 [Phytophthora cactorum]
MGHAEVDVETVKKSARAARVQTEMSRRGVAPQLVDGFRLGE